MKKVLSLICAINLLIAMLPFSVNAAVIDVSDNESVVFSFEENENPVMDTSDPNNLARGNDGIGCTGWGLHPRSDGDVNGLGYFHGNGGADWSDPGGYRLNNNDGVYNLETSTTYIVSFKLLVKSTPLNTSRLTNSMTSYVRFGYGFTGSTSGNTCSKMHVTVAEIVNAKSVASTDKEKGTFTLTTMSGSSLKNVGKDWYNLTFVFTTPDTFGAYTPSLGFFSSCYYGTDFMIDDVSVTKLGKEKGVVVLFDDYSESVTALTGQIGENADLPELTGKELSHEFIGWFKDEARSEKADALHFTNDIQIIYSAWKAPVTVTFVDTLNNNEYSVTGLAGETIVYPNDPIDKVNNPEQYWFIDWYTTENYENKFIDKSFGYSNITVYSKWMSEIEDEVEDFENYTAHKRWNETGADGSVYYGNANSFGAAMFIVSDDTDNQNGNVLKLNWDASMVKIKEDPSTYNAAERYSGLDNVALLQNVSLMENVSYKITFDYYVETLSQTQVLKVCPYNTHRTNIWGERISFKDTQSAFYNITSKDKDGAWHKGEMALNMQFVSSEYDAMFFVLELAENTDVVVYFDNIRFEAVQPYEASILYIANNDKPSKLIVGKAGEKLEEYKPTFGELPFGGWFTDTDFTNEFTETELIKDATLLYGKWKNAVYNDPTRSQLHFSTKKGRLGDPNGLVYNAYRDEYHLFYQLNPISTGWGDMHWGHAISKDLVHWEDFGSIVPADDKGAKWSGSAVIDRDNTSGLFDESTHPEDRMVLIITNWKPGQKTYIFLCYSTDGGRTVKYYNDGKAVLYVQDPKVVWHEETKRWLLVATDSVIYYSDNLIDWHAGGMLYHKNGSRLPFWECPDLYPMKVEGNENEVKWIFNAAGSWYTVGRLEANGDTYNYYAETNPLKYNGDSNQMTDDTRYFDNSLDKCVYATQSYFNDKNGRRISFSWLQEEHFGNRKWKGYQSFPYEQKLVKENGEFIMYSYPVEELNSLRREVLYNLQNFKTTVSENVLEGVNLQHFDIETSITLDNTTNKVGFKIYGEDKNNYINVYYDNDAEALIVDKSASGSNYLANISVPMKKLEDNEIKLRIILDNGVIEVFGNNGVAPIATVTDTFRCSEVSMTVEGEAVVVNKLAVYRMQSAWFDLGYTTGDVNGDNSVNAVDLAELKKVIAGLMDADVLKNKTLDSNDGEPNAADLALLKKILASLL